MSFGGHLSTFFYNKMHRTWLLVPVTDQTLRVMISSISPLSHSITPSISMPFSLQMLFSLLYCFFVFTCKTQYVSL